MTTSEAKLHVLRLQIRVDILQSIVFQIALFASADTLGASARERQRQLLERLEEAAQTGEQIFLRADRGDEAERALYADEFREVVEQMKNSLKKFPV